MSFFSLLRGAEILTEKGRTKGDILTAGTKIAAIGDLKISGIEYDEHDLTGFTVSPGLIDSHVHLIGGGGEAGPSTRAPEVLLSKVTSAGITTVVGLLGTDGTTRHMESLLAKARGLEIEGISTYIYTGSYQIPSPTITGSIRNDIILIDKVVGAGEIAMSDHRSSQPTYEDYIKLAADVRMGGMLSGKGGVLVLHMGDGKRGMKYLFDIVENSEIPISHFIPTHVNRNEALFKESLKWGKMGGYIDITSGIGRGTGMSGMVAPATAIKMALDAGVAPELILMSSDGNGSMTDFDENGNIRGLTVAPLSTIGEEIREAVLNEGVDMAVAVNTASLNVAKALKLQGKGLLTEGYDADIVAFDKDMCIKHVWAKGRHMVHNGEVLVKGTFE